jgi:hypothetical protein
VCVCVCVCIRHEGKDRLKNAVAALAVGGMQIRGASAIICTFVLVKPVN